MISRSCLLYGGNAERRASKGQRFERALEDASMQEPEPQKAPVGLTSKIKASTARMKNPQVFGAHWKHRLKKSLKVTFVG